MLAKRLYEHKKYFKSWTNQTGWARYYTSCEIVKYPDCYIELVENFPCTSKSELEKREGEVVRSATNSVNKCIPGRTQAEWHQDNRDTRLAQMKQYQAINKDKIAANKTQKIACSICNSMVSKQHIARHKKSKRCQAASQTTAATQAS
jgi:hypothetical protein